jgi:hypothetical protein
MSAVTGRAVAVTLSDKKRLGVLVLRDRLSPDQIMAVAEKQEERGECIVV